MAVACNKCGCKKVGRKEPAGSQGHLSSPSFRLAFYSFSLKLLLLHDPKGDAILLLFLATARIRPSAAS
ncbi:hypothetical protein CLOSCI_01163 [[Clostridium] scindens ATCC 35704]|nr:hypothetical protein CLOSCI_01163 [[Clostridium] scindens ATCC 35704]